MRIGGGNVLVNARVRGNVQFKGTKLTLGKDAILVGSLAHKWMFKLLALGSIVRIKWDTAKEWR